MKEPIIRMLSALLTGATGGKMEQHPRGPCRGGHTSSGSRNRVVSLAGEQEFQCVQESGAQNSGPMREQAHRAFRALTGRVKLERLELEQEGPLGVPSESQAVGSH